MNLAVTSLGNYAEVISDNGLGRAYFGEKFVKQMAMRGIELNQTQRKYINDVVTGNFLANFADELQILPMYSENQAKFFDIARNRDEERFVPCGSSIIKTHLSAELYVYALNNLNFDQISNIRNSSYVRNYHKKCSQIIKIDKNNITKNEIDALREAAALLITSVEFEIYKSIPGVSANIKDPIATQISTVFDRIDAALSIVVSATGLLIPGISVFKKMFIQNLKDKIDPKERENSIKFAAKQQITKENLLQHITSAGEIGSVKYAEK